VTLVGPEAALVLVRDVTADLLSRDGITVVWRKADRVRVEDIIESPAGGRETPVVVWVDVSAGLEARIYFRAAAGRRFVIRRVALPRGPGPLAAEEIAQIIQSVLRALAADTAWALSLAEARVALSVPEQRPPAATPAPARATVVEIGSAVDAQLFAPDLPVTAGLGISVAALSRRAPAPAPGLGTLGGRLTFGYGFPARFADRAVGAELRVVRFRLQLIWEPWRLGRVALRLGAGGGADRVEYLPTAEMSGAMAAAADSFLTPVGGADAALHLELSPRFALSAAVLAEIALQRIHYDAYDAAGNLNEVLVPYRVRPGVAIGLEVRL
jgi:hypothetical protein